MGLLMLGVVVIGIFLAHRTRFGNRVHAIGGSATSANLMGISTRSTTIRIYMLSTGLATLAGIVFSVYTQAGYALAGVGVELDAIASVVIGGTLLSGGVGQSSARCLAWRSLGRFRPISTSTARSAPGGPKSPSAFCCLFLSRSSAA